MVLCKGKIRWREKNVEYILSSVLHTSADVYERHSRKNLHICHYIYKRHSVVQEGEINNFRQNSYKQLQDLHLIFEVLA